MTFFWFVSQDKVLAQLLETCKDEIVSYHEHESLLDHKQEEELSEAERKAAWAEYEAEVKRYEPQRRLLLVSPVLFYLLCVFFSQPQPVLQSAQARTP